MKESITVQDLTEEQDTPEDPVTQQATNKPVDANLAIAKEAICEAIASLANTKPKTKVMTNDTFKMIEKLKLAIQHIEKASQNQLTLESVHTELQEIKKTVSKLPTWTQAAQKALSQPLQADTRKMEIQETNRKRAIARKQEKAKIEVTLTAAGALDATRNTLNTATHEEIVSYC